MHRRRGPARWPVSVSQTTFILVTVTVFAAVLTFRSRIAAGQRTRLLREDVHGPVQPLGDMLHQQALIENIYKRSQPFENNALQKLSADAFEYDIALHEGKRVLDNTKWIWDFFPPNFNCPLKERFGRQERIGDGGKWVCGVETLMQRKGCVVYSFGSNGDTEFEAAVLATTKCEVHVFDPTLGQDALAKLAKQPKIHFHAIGLGPTDEQVNMTDHTMTMGVQRNYTMDLLTLQTIMRILNHKWLDVLKIDIEGFEYAVLQQLMKTSRPTLPVTQMLVEFHYWENQRRTMPSDIVATMKALTSNNFRVFSTEPNWWWTNKGYEFIEYSFLHVDGSGQVLLPGPHGSTHGCLAGVAACVYR